LVAVGTAAFVDLAMHLSAEEGAVGVISDVVSGIAFFGAGVSTAIDPSELDAVAADLRRPPGVRHATREVNTTD
jgi:hypothetical protein